MNQKTIEQRRKEGKERKEIENYFNKLLQWEGRESFIKRKNTRREMCAAAK